MLETPTARALPIAAAAPVIAGGTGRNNAAFQYAASQRVFDRRGVIYSGLGSCSTRRQKNLAGSSLLRLLIWLQKEVPVAMFDRLFENSSYLSDLLIIQRIAPKPIMRW